MGLYSLLAARAGAKHVVAVDTSCILDATREVARENKIQNITFLRGHIREVLEELPFKKFDIILCEWMGAFLVNEPVLSDVLFARDELLAEGGVLCPNKTSIHVVGVSDYYFRLDTEDYWSNVYGFQMSAMKELVRREVETCAIPSCNIVTNTCLAHTIQLEELEKITAEEHKAYEAAAATSLAQREKQNPIELSNIPCGAAQKGVEAPFAIVATRDATVNYLTFYVDAIFTSPADVGANFMISVRPGGRNAWTEVSVGLQTPLPVKAGESIVGTFSAHTPNEGNGKKTIVRVNCKTEGKVTAVETSGEYIYQNY
ncbi:arginine N-methyltransferase [Angomonas deanei]|uniref:Protein arginine N-methyltransferase domain-containing protein n=1 Tax=Angomonas deanei TaxID=59799 RepID=A0A7G2CWM8_9TRYP|nr:arginine N-methyltransferase [Angomonas deanei]CAD2222662.1 hypothetical protein, conserved [Angomonas deanei]|eukprot:EPY25300.1 arginine N-methyltransferase [Angomonas deanei]